MILPLILKLQQLCATLMMGTALQVKRLIRTFLNFVQMGLDGFLDRVDHVSVHIAGYDAGT